MNVKRVLPVLLLLAGFAVPLQAQGTLPVQVVCVKGDPDNYKPICGHTKQAVNRSPLYRQAKNGNRYVVILDAFSGRIEGGDIVMSITMGARISDPLSQVFMYHIATIPWVFSPSESSITGELIVSEGLPVAILFFSLVVDEINSYGASGRELTEATEAAEDILRKMKLGMNRFLKEQTN